MFFKSCVGYVLSNCLNAKKKIHLEYENTIQHSIGRSQTIKCIQYNIHDTELCELPKYKQIPNIFPVKMFFKTKIMSVTVSLQ